MELSTPDTPAPTDDSAERGTGPSLAAWFRRLDDMGGLATGRLELTLKLHELRFADNGKGNGNDRGQVKTRITSNHTRIQDRVDADRLRAGGSAALDASNALLEKTN